MFSQTKKQLIMYKKTGIAALLLTSIVICNNSQAQGINGLIKKATGSAVSSLGGGISKDEIASGLKEALNKGVQKGTTQLSAVDGFLGNAAVKIWMPEEAVKVEKKLRDLGMGSQVDQAITSMNRAAEDAAKSAAPIFVDAIKNMSIQDAVGILKGTDTAATGYLRNNTSAKLIEAFRPVIEKSLDKVDATKYWNGVFTTYNQIPFVKKVNTDLAAYVTEKALAGIFVQVAAEEKNIRGNAAARTTDLLKKVFGN